MNELPPTNYSNHPLLMDLVPCGPDNNLYIINFKLHGQEHFEEADQLWIYADHADIARFQILSLMENRKYDLLNVEKDVWFSDEEPTMKDVDCVLDKSKLLPCYNLLVTSMESSKDKGDTQF